MCRHPHGQCICELYKTISLLKLRRTWWTLFFFFNDTAPTEISPLPPHAALRISVWRRHGPRLAQDLRHRGLVARPEPLSRDLELLELRRLPGPPHGRALPAEGRKGHALRAHPERLGPRRQPHPDRGAGELPERGR